jgi:hypothetical protein
MYELHVHHKTHMQIQDPGVAILPFKLVVPKSLLVLLMDW